MLDRKVDCDYSLISTNNNNARETQRAHDATEANFWRSPRVTCPASLALARIFSSLVCLSPKL